MVQLPNVVITAEDADAMLDAIARFTQRELPFLSQVAQLALQARSLHEREQAVASLYRLGLEHEQPYVTDLADELLCWIERELDQHAA